MLNTGKLRGITIFITGASRGIGKAIALKAAKDGANIIIAAKTAEPHPKLPGTIYTAAKEVEEAGGKALACVVDIRNEDQIYKAVDEAIKKFGGIDILINNASAISLTPTLQTDMKKYDLMNNINARGTFLVSKACLPHLKKGTNPHILNLSPPINLNPVWFENHLAYTMAKYGMSFCVLGMHKEFKNDGVAVNALWPKTAIQTAAMDMLAGDESFKVSRKVDIMADAAYAILIKDSKSTTGNFFIDEEVLRAEGIEDFKQYACVPENSDNLLLDFFLDVPDENKMAHMKEKLTSQAPQEKQEDPGVEYTKKINYIFSVISKKLTPELVQKTNAVYKFNVTGPGGGVWHLDLKTGSGSAGEGDPSTTPDVVLTMNAKDFFDLFEGRSNAMKSFMSGKLKIKGNIQKAMKLEPLMSSLKSKM